MLTVNRQDGGVVLLSQLQDQFAGNDQRLFVCQRNRLSCLNGMDGGRQACKTYHSGEHHINRTSLNNVVEGLLARIYLDVRTVAHQRFQCVVAGLVGNDDSCGIKLMGLFGQ